MRRRFRSGRMKSNNVDGATSSGKIAAFSGDDLEKLFDFARKRYAADFKQEEPIAYSFNTGRRQDQLSLNAIHHELDAARHAIQDIKALANEGRRTFKSKLTSERALDADAYTRSKLEEGAASVSGDDTIEGDVDGGSTRKSRRRRGLFRR